MRPEEYQSQTDDSSNLESADQRVNLARESGGWLTRKTKSILFINVYCIFDTVDNINAKIGMQKGVSVLDLAFSRIFMNFVSACLCVYVC